MRTCFFSIVSLSLAACVTLFPSHSWVTHRQGKQMIRPVSDDPVITSMTRIWMWWRSLWLCQWRGLPARLEVINNYTFFFWGHPLSSHLDYSLGLMCNMVTKKCQDVDECTDTRYHFPHHITILYIYHYITITIYHYISLCITISLFNFQKPFLSLDKGETKATNVGMSNKRDQLRDSLHSNISDLGETRSSNVGFTLLARTPLVRLGDTQWMNWKNWSNLSQWRNSWELSVWIFFDVSILPLCFYFKFIDTPQGSFSCPCDTGFHNFKNMTGCSDINELTCFRQLLSFLKKVLPC